MKRANLNATYARELRHALRQVRGAFTSASVAKVRHGNDELATADIAHALLLAARLERALCAAIDRVQATRPARKARAA